MAEKPNTRTVQRWLQEAGVPPDEYSNAELVIDMVAVAVYHMSIEWDGPMSSYAATTALGAELLNLAAPMGHSNRWLGILADMDRKNRGA